MKFSLLMSISVLLTASIGFSKTRDFQITFTPAFIPASTIKISGEDNNGSLSIEDKKFDLTESQSEELFEMLDFYLGELTPSKTKAGMDGVGVKLRYTVSDKLLFSNEVWSPTEGPEPEAVQAVFLILEDLDLPQAQREYFEQLSSYFDFARPWRLIIDDPITIRFYSSLSISDAFELHRLFNSIPLKTPVVVDMTNFQGMGTLLHDDFQRFNSTHNVVTWLSSVAALEHLQQIGIPAQKIVTEQKSKKPNKAEMATPRKPSD